MDSFNSGGTDRSTTSNTDTSNNDNSNQDDMLAKGHVEQDGAFNHGATVPKSEVGKTANTHYKSDKSSGYDSNQDKTGADVVESINTLKSPYIALLLSFLFTGFGQIYNRRIFQGIVLFIVVWVLIIFSLNIKLFTLFLVPDFILNFFPLFTKLVLIPLSIYYVWVTPKLTSLFDKKLLTILLLLSYVIKLQTILNPIAYVIWFLSVISAFVNSPHKFEKLNTQSENERTE